MIFCIKIIRHDVNKFSKTRQNRNKIIDAGVSVNIIESCTKVKYQKGT